MEITAAFLDCTRLGRRAGVPHLCRDDAEEQRKLSEQPKTDPHAEEHAAMLRARP